MIQVPTWLYFVMSMVLGLGVVGLVMAAIWYTIDLWFFLERVSKVVKHYYYANNCHIDKK